MSHVSILIVTMLVVGAAGGVINYYTQTSKRETDSSDLLRFMFIGAAITFIVPFLLDLMGSPLIDEIEGDATKMLNYIAMCLIASIMTRFFLISVSDDAVLEAKLTRDKVEQLQYQLRQLQEELLPLIDTETEDDMLADAAVVMEALPEELDTTSSRVLKTLGCGRFIYRSMAGLCREADTDESTMMKTLSFLTLRSLAGKVGGRKGVRWYITERGRKLVELNA